MSRRSSNVATRLAKWLERGSPVTMGLPGSGTIAGVPILVQQFGYDLHLAVEIAWGADVNADSSTWLWADITRDAMIGDGGGIAVTLGKADEASTTQPAVVGFNLDDRLNKYNLSAFCGNWPYVRRGVPVRVRVIYKGASFTRFSGNAVGFNPSFDPSAKFVTSTVTANGVLRRIDQGTDPLHSTLEHAIAGANPPPVAYWPMEDGASSTLIRSALPGGNPMTFFGLNLAADSGLTGSDALPTFTSTGSVLGVAVAAPTAQHWEVHWYHKFTQPASDTIVMQAAATGTYDFWEVIANGTGSGANAVTVNAYSAGVKTVLVNAVAFPDFYGTWTHNRIILDEVTGTLTWTFETFKLGGLNGGLSFGFLFGTSGIIKYVTQPPAAALSGISMGQVSIWGLTPGLNQDTAQTGYTGENAVTRISRLCAEQSVPLVVTGASNQTMGPQSINDLINLLRECEQVDGGVLYDGLTFGLSYLSRDLREDLPVALTLDATLNQVSGDFRPVNDDQSIRNRWTISRQGGSTATVEQTTGTNGSAVVGLYQDSKTLNTGTDTVLADQAGWRVAAGILPGYRYPGLNIAFHSSPELLAPWLNYVNLFSRVIVANLHTVAGQLANDPVDLVIEGYSEVISQNTWTVGTNSIPFDSWRVAQLAADTGDLGEFVGRPESDGSTVVGGADIGASSLTVATPSGPLWTTVADDLGIYVGIGGIRVTVTNISGASSPQTFTVDPASVVKPLRDGDTVSVWKEPVLGL